MKYTFLSREGFLFEIKAARDMHWYSLKDSEQGLLTNGTSTPILGFAKYEFDEVVMYNLHLIWIKVGFGWLK